MNERTPRRVLLLHGEAIYFGGAETLLTRIAAAGLGEDIQLTVARVANSPLARALPTNATTIDLPANQPFSLRGLRRQLAALPLGECDVLHAWGARSWELAALAGRLADRPVIGTLHDHPAADYLTPARRRLMRWTARWGLHRVTVVSETLRAACVAAGWPADKLVMIRNGLAVPPAPTRTIGNPVCFGFLGALTATKGLPDLLASVDALARRAPDGWELHIAGRTQTDAEAKQLRAWQAAWQKCAWWPQVHWHGWVTAEDFLRAVDVLIVPSRAWETFSLAVAEAALHGVPSVAACIGALPELVIDGQTGWLFPSGDWDACASILQGLLAAPMRITSAGLIARKQGQDTLSFSKMLEEYSQALRCA